jgi:hypothetical protein
MMVDGCGNATEAKPGPSSLVGTMPTPFGAADISVTKVAKKVVAVADRLSKISLNEAPLNLAYAQALEDGRIALLEMVETPAFSYEACKAKLDILGQMSAWYQEGDPDILKCFMVFSQEVVGLFQQATQGQSVEDDRSPGAGLSKSVRWFFGVAAAVPSAFLNRWDSGGLS